MINQEEINRLNNKVDVAFASAFVGDVIFSEKEINELSSLALESLHKDGHPYFDYYTAPIDLETAKRIFIIIVHITQAECCDDISGSWYSEIALELKIYGFPYIYDIAGFLDCVLNALTNETFILNGRRIRTTFMIHSLVPTWSMESLFEFCWNLYFNRYELNMQYIDEPELYIDYAREFRRRFYPSTNDEKNSTLRIDFDGKAYKFRIGLIETIINRNDEFGYLFDRIIYSIDQLVKGQSIDVSSSYLNLLINTWYENKLDSKSEINLDGEGGVEDPLYVYRDYGIKLKPKIYFRLLGDSIFLVISSFNLYSNHDANSHIELHIKEHGIEIINEVIPIKATSRSLLSETEEKVLPMSSDMNVNSDYLFDLTIDIIGENGKYILKDVPLYRDFILFSSEYSGSEIAKHRADPGLYIVFCTSKIKETLNNIFSEIGDLYCVNFEDGEAIFGKNNSCEFYFQNYEKLFSFSPLSSQDEYLFNGINFPIIGVLSLTIDKLVNLDRFGFIYTEYGEQEKTTIIPLKMDVNLHPYNLNDERNNYATFSDFTEGVPFSIKLVMLNDVSNIIAETKGIYFSNLDIFYSTALCLEENFGYTIKLNGKTLSHGEISAETDLPVYVNFLNGQLALNSVPIFKIKIGDELYPFYKLPNYFYFENIPINSSISLICQHQYIEIVFNGKSYSSPFKGFGQEVHKLAESYYAPYKLTLKIKSYEFFDKEISLTDIYFRPTFLTPPIVAINDSVGNAILHWDPSDFIGPINPLFSIELVNQSTGSTYEYSNFDLTERDFGLEEIDAGNYLYHVFLMDREGLVYSDYFTHGNIKDIRLAETIYISNCHIHDYKPKLYGSNYFQKKMGTTYAITGSKKVVSSDGEFLFNIGRLYKKAARSDMLTRVDRISKDIISTVIWRQCTDSPNWNIELRFLDTQYEPDSKFESGRLFAVTKFSDNLIPISDINEPEEKSDLLYELVNVVSDFKLDN